MALTSIGLLLACASFQTASSDDPRTEVFEAFFTQLAQRGQFNGNILVAEKGKVIYEAAIGMRSVKAGDELDLDAQFRLGSACAGLTALAVMTLEEAGDLSYEDPVKKYIPEWPYQGATIRNLLNETSGFPDITQVCDKHWKPELDPDDPDRLIGDTQQVLQLVNEHLPEIRFEPGAVWTHNGTDYFLLAAIVEKVSGLPFHQYMRERVFLRAGMTDTHVYSPSRDDPLTERAYGITDSADGLHLNSLDFDYLQTVIGFGIYSTLHDLNALDRVLYTDRLVSQASLREAYTKGKLTSGKQSRSGFGWTIGDAGVSLDGYRAGFGIWIRRDLEEQTAIIVLTNRNLALWSGINQGLMQILRGNDYQLPKLDGATLVGQTLVREGEEAARARYQDIKGQPDKYDLGGVMGLQALAHFLALEGYETEALFANLLNSEEYPEIAWVWTWLGDGYHTLGDTDNAVAAYRKALTIDKNAKRALEMLTQLGKR